MAQNVQIPIEVVDKFSTPLNSFKKQMDAAQGTTEKASKSFDMLRAGIDILVGARVLGALTSGIKGLFNELAKSETAVNRMSNAMRNLGTFNTTALKDQQDFAASIAKVTTATDEQVLEMQASMVTFGLYGEGLNRATKAALNLSRAQGLDLQTSAFLVGKAFQGQTETLSRYGIRVKSTGDNAKDFNAVLLELERRFGGSAQREMDTMAGKLANLNNRWGEIKEIIAAQLTPAFDFWISKIETAIGLMERLTGSHKNAKSIYDETLAQLREEAVLTQEDAKNKQRRIDAVLRLRNAEADRANAVVEGERRVSAAAGRAAADQKKANEEAMKAEQEHQKSVEQTAGVIGSNFASTFSSMITNTNLAKQKMTQIFSDMARRIIADLVRIALQAAVTRAAMSLIGGGGGFGGFFGLEQGGIIGAADGVIVGPRKPTFVAPNVVAGEGREPELVAPLSKLPGIAQQLGLGGAGQQFGDVHITITAGNLGSAADRRTLVRDMVDALKIQNGDTIAFGRLTNNLINRGAGGAA